MALVLTACGAASDPLAAQSGGSLGATASVGWRVFAATARRVDAETVHASWRPGCPVGLDELRLIELRHWGFDDRVQEGELIVHRDWVEPVIETFRRLFEHRYPIERMERIDVHGGDDDASMEANNSSGFNCREIAGRPGVWSEHAYGRAIDLNPVQNPYVRGSTVSPPAGAAFADRTAEHPAMIRAGDAVVEAFAAIGWSWGGDWAHSKDYQHFSSTGR